MKTVLFLLTIGLFGISSLYAKDSFKEKLTLIEDRASREGGNTLFLSFLMKKDGKTCRYSYMVGRISGYFENKCTNKKYPFSVKDDNGKFTDDVPKWSPIPYMNAHEMITGIYMMPVGASIIRTVDSKGIIIFCTTEMKICKTDAEVKKYVQNTYFNK